MLSSISAIMKSDIDITSIKVTETAEDSPLSFNFMNYYILFIPKGQK